MYLDNLLIDKLAKKSQVLKGNATGLETEMVLPRAALMMKNNAKT